jgi:hypothetical protein
MSYTLFQPTGGRCGIPQGRFTLSGKGMGRFNSLDLSAVGVAEQVSILMDHDAKSLALRAPLEGESGVMVNIDGPGGKRRVWLAGALAALGLDGSALRGDHACHVESIDGVRLLVLDLLQQ